MKKTIVTLFAAMMALGAWAKTTGSCREAAKSIKVGGSATVKLTAEYDEFENSYDSDSGVYWLKVDLNKNTAYTVWIKGGAAASMELSVDTNEKDDADPDSVPGAAFDDTVSLVYNGAPVQYAYMLADAWDAEDPNKFSYAICLVGDVGATTTVYVQQGNRAFTQTGDANTPKTLSFKTTSQTYTAKLLNGSYYMKATLEAGGKYLVRTLRGTDAKPFDLEIDSLDDDVTYDEWADPKYADMPSYTNANVAAVIIPDSKGTFTFAISDDTKDGSNSAGQFQFAYQRVPSRAITAHKAVTLNAENNWSHKFVPGRISNNEAYYDSIVDENLCVVKLAKGDRVVFSTEDTYRGTCEMIVYDPTGKILGRSTTIGNGSPDMRVAIQAATAGNYYVGVYDTLLGVEDEPDDDENKRLTLTVASADEFPVPDAADPVDDTYAGATELVAAPLSYGEDLLVGGSVSEVHGLNGGDWYDYFKVACRAGQTYTFKAEFDGAASDVVLGYDIYTLNANGNLAKVAYASGTKTYVDGLSLDGGVTLNATANTTYYIKAYTAIAPNETNTVAAVGLDYPDYRIYSGVTKANTVITADPSDAKLKVTNVVDTALGMLVVKSTGIAGTFAIGKETTKYPTGTSLALAGGTYTVAYTAPAGFKARVASESAVITAWNTNSAERVVSDQPVTTNTVCFYDIYDAKYQTGTTKSGTKTVPVYSPATGDDTIQGAFALTPADTVKTVSRSLYKEDAADHFKFTALAGRSYSMSLADYVDGGATGAVMTVFNVVGGKESVITNNVKSLEKVVLPAGVVYVRVEHEAGCEDMDSSYSLSYSAVNVGTIGFSAASYAYSETAEYATLTLKRTAKQGAVSVNFATVEGTAKPGTEYYPTNGVVTWAANDMANKSIKVRLIPDLAGEWDSNKVFTVKLWATNRTDLAANEYPVQFTYSGSVCLDTATVKITEATAVKPGTIAVTGFGPSKSAMSAVANVKAPVVSGQVGAPLVLRLSRTGGCNGTVGVRFAFPGKNGKTADTAAKNKDYVPYAVEEVNSSTNTVVWGDLDAEDKYVTVNTLMTTNYVLSKQFTFTLAALTTKGYSKPALSGATGTAKLNSNIVGTTAATFANTVKAVGGITQAVTGTWFVDRNDGRFKTSPLSKSATITYTLTGPGFFAMKKPRINDGGGSETPSVATLKLQIGALNAKKAFVASETIDCLAGEAPDRIERIIASGSRIVKLTFAGGNGKEFVELDNDDDTGLPFKWVRFATVAVDRPIAGSVVSTNGVTLKWKVPAALQDEKVKVVARFGASAKLGAANDIATNDVNKASADVEGGSLVAGKTYYWTLAFGIGEEPAWTAHPTTWNFSVVQNGYPTTSLSGKDARGDEVLGQVSSEEPIRLIQAVKASLSLSGTESANRYRLLAGKLPPGLAINATTGKLTGTPTTVGEYDAVLQSYYYNQTTKTVKGKKQTTTTTRYGASVQVKFVVEPAGLAIGTFRGALVEDGDQVAKKSAKTGLLTVTTTSAGKITATVKISGNTYTFSGTGYDELSDEKDDGGLEREYTVELKNITKLSKTTTTTKNGRKTTVTTTTPYTNTLELVVWDAPVTNAVAIGQSIGSARLVMNVPNTLVAKAATMEGDIEYNADLFRSSANTEVVKDALAGFAGYYTIALAPDKATLPGVPLGNGYLTMTLTSAGAATFAGMLADGVAVSASSGATLQGDDVLDPGQCALYVPFHFSADVRSLTGVVKLVYAEDDDGNVATVVDSTSRLLWCRDASATTSVNGDGYAIEIWPTGGWYNKTWNVQRYYLDSDLSIQAAGAEELNAVADKDGVLAGTNFTFKVNCTPTDLDVKLANNVASVAASRSLVKESSTLLYDLVKSVNPWAASFSYVRATGLVSGTFSAWKEDYDTTKQVEIKSIAHKGVMIFYRDAASTAVLDENIWSAGYYLIKATKNWTASLPFNVIATPVDGGRDWNETPVPGSELDGND